MPKSRSERSDEMWQTNSASPDKCTLVLDLDPLGDDGAG